MDTFISYKRLGNDHYLDFTRFWKELYTLFHKYQNLNSMIRDENERSIKKQMMETRFNDNLEKISALESDNEDELAHLLDIICKNRDEYESFEIKIKEEDLERKTYLLMMEDEGRRIENNIRDVYYRTAYETGWGLVETVTNKSRAVLATEFLTNRKVMDSADEVVGFVSNSAQAGTVCLVVLNSVILSYDVIKAMKDWLCGDITGKRCSKLVVDALTYAGASYFGSIGGAAVAAALFGPVGWLGLLGSLICGVVGGFAAHKAAECLLEYLGEYVFDLPKDEALEKAYEYLGVKMSATNEEVNSAYKKLCLKHHPDKQGSNDEFLKLQIYMNIIKLARGDSAIKPEPLEAICEY